MMIGVVMKKKQSDDWSLKDKKKQHFWEGDIDDAYDWADDSDSYYRKSDIDVLRQKLIEDLNEWVRQHDSKIAYTSNAHYELIDIVKKRFGVDE